LSENVITALFACPLDSTSSSVNAHPTCVARPTRRLAEFIAYALHRTRLPEEVTFQALFLLRRLKNRFPAARGSSGHRLFISALMLASKSSCDDTYSNKSWTIVSQGLFSLREVNQMERELFGYLGFKVNVEMEELVVFRDLLLNGDIAAVVDCGSAQCSPNPATMVSSSSSAMDRGCETPTSRTPTKSISVDSAPFIRFTQYNQVNSISSYPGDVHTTTTGSPRSRSTSNQGQVYVRSGSAPFDRQNPFQTAAYAQNGSTSMTSLSSLSPSSASHSSSRGSISSASGYGMVPSPTSLSQSESSSSQTSPDTPPQELCTSPWSNVDAKSSNYNGEPAGTYQDNIEFYQQFKNQAYYAQQQHQPQSHIYASAVADPRARHPYN
jgi:hypothetical protein